MSPSQSTLMYVQISIFLLKEIALGWQHMGNLLGKTCPLFPFFFKVFYANLIAFVFKRKFSGQLTRHFEIWFVLVFREEKQKSGNNSVGEWTHRLSLILILRLVCCFDSDYCYDTAGCFVTVLRWYCQLVHLLLCPIFMPFLLFVFETYSVDCTCLYNDDLYAYHEHLLTCLWFVCFLYILVSNRAEGKVLETVGVFEAPKQHGKYETGQVSV